LSSSTDRGLVEVGRIGRPHGVRGDVTVVPSTDDPSRFAPGSHLRTNGEEVLVVLSAIPYRDRGLIVGFEGVGDRAAAERLRGTVLLAEAQERRPLEAGEFWPGDLLGLEAVSPTGDRLGEITDVDFGIGQDRLVITTPLGDVLVPFVADIVDDPADGRIVVRDPGGLFPL
jgi:16S rRNA processing protein RimM